MHDSFIFGQLVICIAPWEHKTLANDLVRVGSAQVFNGYAEENLPRRRIRILGIKGHIFLASNFVDAGSLAKVLWAKELQENKHD
jgi:hypothetical protein